MAGGYSHKPKGVQQSARRLSDLQKQIDQQRGSAGINSAKLRGKLIEFQDSNGNTLVQVGDELGVGTTFDNSAGLAAFSPTGDQPLLLIGFNDQWDAVGLYIFDADGAQLMQVHDVVGDASYVNFGLDPLDGVVLDHFSVYANQTIFLMADTAGGQIIMRAASGIFFDSLATTATAANANINSVSGEIRRVSSGRKYKADIQPVEVDLDDARAFLSLGRTWVDRGELERDPNYSERTPGSIAEDLDDLPSMRQFVLYDEDGNPDAISYDRLYVALLPLLKEMDEVNIRQQAEIDDLKAEVAAIKKALEAQQ